MELKPKYLRIDFPDLSSDGSVLKNLRLYARNEESPRKKKVLQKMENNNISSHYNTLIGYSRIPTKYDHFHEKTYEKNYLPTLRSLSNIKFHKESRSGKFSQSIESGALQKKKIIQSRILNKYIMPASIEFIKIQPRERNKYFYDLNF